MSRCQRYDFKRITIDTIAGRLTELIGRENLDVEDKAVRYIARAADGSMRDALSLLDQCVAFYLGQRLTYDNVLDVLGAVDTSVFSRLLRCIDAGRFTEAVRLLEEVVIQGRELTQFVTDFIWYLRNLLLVQGSGDLEDILDIPRKIWRPCRRRLKRLIMGGSCGTSVFFLNCRGRSAIPARREF